jgi:nicotinate-nucleotide adenylyltransferase
MMVRLGVFGGTFNPIHYGHLIAANEVWDALALDLVVFVPAAIPPHKLLTEIIDPQHRLMMAILATVTHPQFSVSAIEIERRGASYTVDTISQLKQQHAEPLSMYFIVGVDAFLDIVSWRQPDVLLGSCHTVVISRPGHNLYEQVPATLQQLSRGYPHLHFEALASESMEHGPRYDVQGTSYQVFLQTIAGVDISSSAIRQRVKNGRSLRYLVPDSVDAYIRKYQLYH